jgi:hypothetical protein
MKKIIVLFFIAFTISFYGQDSDKNPVVKVEKSTIILDDKNEIVAEIDFPIMDEDKPLKYKVASGKAKIDREKINKVVFITNQGTVEYVNMKVYNETNSKIQKERKLLVNLLKGKISVYTNSYVHNQFSYYNSVSKNQGIGFANYYCIREGEEGASLIHVESNFANKNVFFRQNGKRYFEDDAQIKTKIENREYTYKNLFEVVELYNSKK